MKLNIDNLESGYGEAVILKNISLNVKEGEIVSIFGVNGVGKTTLLRSILGIGVNVKKGRIVFNNVDITNYPPHKRTSLGLGYIPQERPVFNNLKVIENLKVGLGGHKLKKNIGEIYDMFPILNTRRNQLAGTLSGGEKQMLAIARALNLKSTLILCDEPTEGLMPEMVRKVSDTIETLRKKGITILLVTQNISLLEELVDRIYTMRKGRILRELSLKEFIKRKNFVIKETLGF